MDNYYDLFNIEYSNFICEIQEEIMEYTESPYINFKYKKNVGKLINLIYNNIDYEKSSEILNNMKLKENERIEYEINNVDYDNLIEMDYLQ